MCNENALYEFDVSGRVYKTIKKNQWNKLIDNNTKCETKTYSITKAKKDKLKGRIEEEKLSTKLLLEYL